MVFEKFRDAEAWFEHGGYDRCSSVQAKPRFIVPEGSPGFNQLFTSETPMMPVRTYL